MTFLLFMWFPILTWLVATAVALDCSAKDLDSYNFALLQGTHAVESVKDTPPSTTKTTWYFGICELVSSKKAPACPKNVDICGVTEVKVDKDYIVTQVVGFNSNLEKKYTPVESKNENGIKISYKGANWGSSLVNAEVYYICAEDRDGDDTFTVESWDDEMLFAQVKSKAACVTSKDDKKKPKKPEDNGESWGWFTWIFIFMVLFLSIYIIGGAWFQYNKGNAIDFQSALREVLENFVDLVRGLPLFIREIIEKVTGSNRGEYSAV